MLNSCGKKKNIDIQLVYMGIQHTCTGTMLKICLIPVCTYETRGMSGRVVVVKVAKRRLSTLKGLK